jgi:hypothetical protein
LWILVVASIYGIKGTQIFRNGGGKKWIWLEIYKNKLKKKEWKILL